MIAEVEKAVITLDEYFDKINIEMIKNLDQIEIETENIELEINRQLQYIETYRCVYIYPILLISYFYFILTHSDLDKVVNYLLCIICLIHIFIILFVSIKKRMLYITH